MLHIIFLILKIIGIILGLLILLLLLLLFVPIRYECKLDYFESGNGWAKLHWLLHSISGKLIIEQNSPRLVIKLFGIPVRFRKKEKKEESEQEDELERETPVSTPPPNPEVASKPEDSIILEEPLKPVSEAFSDEQSEAVLQEADQEKFSFLRKIAQRIRHFLQKLLDIITKIRSLPETIKRKCHSILRKITSSKKKMSEIKEILLEENSRQVYTFLKLRVMRVIKHLRPKKFHLYVHYGFEDPALTGEVTGIMAVLMVFYENAVSLEPDFQNTVLEGSVKLKGRVQIAVLLWTGIRILLHKQFRVMIKKLMDKIK